MSTETSGTKKIVASVEVCSIFSLLVGILFTFSVSALDLRPRINYYPTIDEPQRLRIPELPQKKPNFREDIFADKVVSDILKRHDRVFGPVNSASIEPAATDLDDYVFGHESRIYQGQYIYERDETREFGRYITRKVAEYQIDKVLKDNHDLRVVKVAKDGLTQEVKPTKNSKLRAKYDLSGHLIRTEYLGSNFSTDVTWEFGRGNRGLDEVSESIISLKVQQSKYVSWQFQIKTYDGVLALRRKRVIRKNLFTTITASTFYKEGEENENLFIAGFEMSI